MQTVKKSKNYSYLTLCLICSSVSIPPKRCFSNMYLVVFGTTRTFEKWTSLEEEYDLLLCLLLVGFNPWKFIRWWSFVCCLLPGSHVVKQQIVRVIIGLVQSSPARLRAASNTCNRCNFVLTSCPPNVRILAWKHGRHAVLKHAITMIKMPTFTSSLRHKQFWQCCLLYGVFRKYQ